MARYKLFRLASLLEHDELNSFAQFLKSPFFNTDLHCVKLFEVLRKYHPGMDHPKLTKEHLFRRVFGKEPYNDQKIRRLMMALSHLLERYFQVQELERSGPLRQQALIRGLEWRGDYALFQEAAEARIAALNDKGPDGKDHFLELAGLYEALHFHPGTDKFTIATDYLEPYIHSMECHFILTTLQNEMECRIKKRFVVTNGGTRFIDSVLAEAKGPGFGRHAVIALFRDIFQLFEANEPNTDLTDLSSRLSGIFHKLDGFEQRMVLKLLSNLMAPLANSESPAHERFIFSIYKLGVENGLLKQGNNPVHPDHFINIANIGAKTHHFQWTENFIRQYGPQLSETEREYACCLASASLFYHQWMENARPETLREALYRLNLIPSRSPEKYDLRARSTHVRILFDAMLQGLSTCDEVITQVSYFERHLKSSQVYSPEKKEEYIKFLRQLRSLAKFANDPNLGAGHLVNFIRSLEGEPVFPKKNWLKGKAQELLNRTGAHP